MFLTDDNEDWIFPNWCDEEFCKDIQSEYEDLDETDLFMGVGRLIFETQRLTEILIIWHGRYASLFKDGKYNFTRENLESSKTIQELRSGPLGRLVHSMLKRGLPYEKDGNVLYEILINRNYFVHEAYSKYIRGKKDVNKDIKRLKKSINTVIKFNNRYLPEINKDLKRMKEGV